VDLIHQARENKRAQPKILAYIRTQEKEPTSRISTSLQIASKLKNNQSQQRVLPVHIQNRKAQGRLWLDNHPLSQKLKERSHFLISFKPIHKDWPSGFLHKSKR